MPLRRFVATVAAVALIAAYQLQLIPLFSQRYVGATTFAAAYYGFWTFICCAALLTISRATMRIFLPAAALITLTLLYPIGPIAKDFIVAMVFFASVAVLSSAAGSMRMLRLVALVTTINACICLVEVLFKLDLSDTPGRAAGLNGNPNLAAIGLLIGAAATYRAVPGRLLGYFLLVVLAGTFVTLSKSALIAYVLIFVPLISLGIRHGLYRFEIKQHVAFAALLICWVATALSVNEGFVFHLESAFHYLASANDQFQSASPNISIEELGNINSISARGLLLKSAWLSYLEHPLHGVGLDQAHRLIPHNSFLLFALAFGPIGWLIPPLFISMAWRNAALAVAIFAVAMVSHDIFLMPALLCPLAIGVATKPRPTQRSET